MISHGRKKDSGPQLQFENNSRYVWLDRVHSGLSCQPFGPWVNMPDDRNTGIYQPYVSDSQNMWWKQLEDFRSESHEYLVASEDEFKSSKTQGKYNFNCTALGEGGCFFLESMRF